MPDLFNQGQPSKEEPKKQRVFYHGKQGRFSDEETARVTKIEKDNKILTVNCKHWKRQAEIQLDNYIIEHERLLKSEARVKELEAQLSVRDKKKRYEYPINSTYSKISAS